MEGINTPFVIDEHTAIVMTDPQNDFLSENGLGWGAFGENIQKNGTVEETCMLPTKAKPSIK